MADDSRGVAEDAVSFLFYIPVGELRIGDVINGLLTNHQDEVVTQPYDPGTLHWETNKHAGPSCWLSCTASAPIPLAHTSNVALAERIAGSVERFPLPVRLALFAMFCTHCGERTRCCACTHDASISTRPI